MEGIERGYRMPIIFATFCNNSAISSRIDYGKHADDPLYGPRRVEQRYKMYGDLFVPGEVREAQDVSGGVEAFRSVVDRVVESGKPSYCIAHFPFRPGGHASDSSPAADDLLLTQFDMFKDILVKQVSASFPEGTKGAEIADRFNEVEDSVIGSVQRAILGEWRTA